MSDEQEPRFPPRDDLLKRGKIMDLIEAEMSAWSDADPPRWALSVVWGKVRDMRP